MSNIFTDHIKDTENPQTYWKHFEVAFFNSCKLLWASAQGIVHAIFPWWWPFTTSTQIIRSFKILIDTGRHKEELQRIIPEGYLLDKHILDK